MTTGQAIKKWGVIYGAIATLVALVPMLIDWQSGWMMLVNIVIAISMFILAMKEFKTENGGFMSFGEGFKISFGMAAIAGILRAVVSYIYTKIIDPEYIERTQQTAIEQLRAQGMSEEQIQQSMSFMAGLSSPEVTAIAGVVMIFIAALIFGSIASAIMKNEEDEF